MLAKSQRLSRVQFAQYFKTATRSHSPAATLLYAPAPTRHAAVVVGKKVAKRAVERNRLRRRVYDVVRRSTTGTTGVYICLLKPAAATLPASQLRGDVTTLIVRARKNQ